MAIRNICSPMLKNFTSGSMFRLLFTIFLFIHPKPHIENFWSHNMLGILSKKNSRVHSAWQSYSPIAYIYCVKILDWSIYSVSNVFYRCWGVIVMTFWQNEWVKELRGIVSSSSPVTLSSLVKDFFWSANFLVFMVCKYYLCFMLMSNRIIGT